MSAAPPTSTPPPGGRPVWGSYGGGTPSPSLGGERPDRLSRRLLQLAGLLSVLLLGVIANAFLNGSDGEGTLELNPVAAAAERVQKCPGARMSMYIVYSSPALPQPLTATGTGAFNGKTDRTLFNLEMNTPIGQMEFVEVLDGGVRYQGGELVARQLPPGKEWVRLEQGEEDDTSLELDEALELMSSSGGVRLVGREPINGIATQRYRGEIQLADLIAHLREQGDDEAADDYEAIAGMVPSTVTAESWIDRKDLMRRFRMVMAMPGDPGDPPMTVDMRMDIFDYGAEPAISVPDPETVVDGPLEESSATADSTI